MALGTGVHNLSLVVRAHNRASRALASVGRDLDLVDRARMRAQRGFAQMSNVGLLAIKALAVGAAAALGGAILAYARFDDKLTGSLAIVDDVSDAMRDRLEETARAISKETIFSASQLAEAYFHLFSAGQTVEQSMQSLPVVAKFAQAGLFDLQEATELLVTSQNALGLAIEDPTANMVQMKRVADVLARADELAVGTIEEFAGALTNRAAAAMRTYNIDVEEGVAVLAAWAVQGLKGVTAGEAFAIVTRDLQKAALKEAAAWRAADAAVFDRQGNMRNLADIVEDLENAMEGLSDAEKKQLLMDLGFQERSQQRLLQLLGTSDAIREFEAEFRKAGGTVEEVAEKQLDSPIKQLILLKNAVVDLFIGAGKTFDEGFVNVIIKVRRWIASIAPDVQEFADNVAAWMTDASQIFKIAWDRITHVNMNFTVFTGQLPEEIETLVGWIETLIEKFQELPEWVQKGVKDWLKLIPIITLASGGLKLILGILKLLGGPGLVVAAALSAIAVGFKTAYEESEEFRAIVDGIVNWFNTTVVPILGQAWEFIQTAWNTFLDWVINSFWPGFQGWLNEMEPRFREIGTQLEGIWENVQIAWANFSAFWAEHGDEIMAKLEEIWDFVVNTAIPDMITIIGDLVTAFNDAFTDINTFFTEHETAVVEVLEGLGEAWNVFFGIFKGIWDILVGILTGDWPKVWNGMGLVVDNVFRGIVNTIVGALNIIIGAVNTIIGALNSINPLSDIPSLTYIPLWQRPQRGSGSAPRNPAPSRDSWMGTTIATFGGRSLEDRDAQTSQGNVVNIGTMNTTADPVQVANEIAYKIRTV